MGKHGEQPFFMGFEGGKRRKVMLRKKYIFFLILNGAV